MENKFILITGGAGFVGSNVALTLQAKYPKNKYFVIDNFSSGSADNLAGFRGEIISGDIATIDLERLFNKIDIIFHQAAITDTTVSDEEKMMSCNVGGFKNVLNFALKHNSRLIYASSAAVYGHSGPPMRVENNEFPANIYGMSKLVADNIARQHFNDIPIVGLRYFNVYGPGESHKGKMASMVWQLYLQMKKGARPRIFRDGEQKRDQVYIKDIVQANLLAMDCNKSGIYNVGSGKAAAFNEIIKNLNAVLKTNLQPEYFDNPFKFYQEYTEADLGETGKFLGYSPKYGIKEGIEDYIKEYESKN